MIKVNQVISNIDKNSGGTATYLQGLSNALSNKGISLTITTLQSNSPLKLDDKIDVKFYHKNKKDDISENRNYDVVHINGIWEFFIHKMVRLTLKNKTPYIISPHGMLEEWSLNQGKLKKKIALWLFQKKDLSNAACIHVTALSEKESVRRLGINNPTAVIPNGIAVSEFPKDPYIGNKNKKTFLFLSRIHPKKGIEFLIQAFAELKHSAKEDWIIKIIGNGDNEYIESLNNKIIAENLSESVVILPPIFDTVKKIEVFRKADVFVLPTFSENFGIVIAEALASYTPVITTKGTPWEDLHKNSCGWWIDIGVEPLKKALEEVLNSDEEVLKQMGRNGRKLVEEQYSIETVANNTLEMYKWVANKIEKPKFIN
ncbi:glycosyltransferase involved in cell wall biosynthesis [Wenyingzhuangia heitensis]|uniref:Glycosyltransferase involved in cell wall biosynthesis n=1 Tax=Wenyingzhuangia heitensis TaxID=1487859 RepID=A0ABX0U812_9FLAO|nr:glycosyltransferase [Wenyingzhuangia heitensis]NIJ44313.1 glycosyltransferase involved in cell wall biosynthesis [Wenyingzhuangia heitensis]